MKKNNKGTKMNEYIHVTVINEENENSCVLWVGASSNCDFNYYVEWEGVN